MAIFHMSAQTISRSKGHSSVAAAAYRHGEKLMDEHTGEIHDYSKKKRYFRQCDINTTRSRSKIFKT